MMRLEGAEHFLQEYFGQIFGRILLLNIAIYKQYKILLKNLRKN